MSDISQSFCRHTNILQLIFQCWSRLKISTKSLNMQLINIEGKDSQTLAVRVRQGLGFWCSWISFYQSGISPQSETCLYEICTGLFDKTKNIRRLSRQIFFTNKLLVKLIIFHLKKLLNNLVKTTFLF